MRRAAAVSLFLVMLLALLPLAARAELFDSSAEVVERLPAGEINWTTGLVRAVGRGASGASAKTPGAARLMAERAAKVDAMRNLLETVGGVRIDAETTVEKLSAKSDSVKLRVKGLVKGARVVSSTYLPDGSAEVVVEAPVGGILAETVYEGLPDMGVAPPPKTGAIVYTGLVVDAKGTGAKPAMSPKVVDEDGKEVYGSKFVKKEFAVRQGIAGFERDLEAAKDHERVRANPIVVKALRTVGKRGTELVVSNTDASRLRDRSKNLGFLEETKVIIVMD